MLLATTGTRASLSFGPSFARPGWTMNRCMSRIVATVSVKRNDKVTAGQSLIALDDVEEKATLEFYRLRADTSLQVAEAKAPKTKKATAKAAAKPAAKKAASKKAK